MEIGFETIGNATVICHDQRPILVTDPWIGGGAYFGSWTLSHEIPSEQLEAIKACEYVWLSHGHPDHLSAESLELLRRRKLLVPNHFGARIYNDLKAQGFDVHTLVDRTWVELSPRIRVMCIPDYNQDAVLLIDVGGCLVVNLNDASDHGWGAYVRKIIRGYQRSFMLALSGYGDADMINYKTEAGDRIPPSAAKRTPVGRTIARDADVFGVTHFVPFSSMHKYQRADSVWADEYTTRLDDYARGFDSTRVTLTPAFIRYDTDRDALSEIRPAERHVVPVHPTEFGDDWAEPLERQDVAAIRDYFDKVERLKDTLGFICFRVAGQDHRLELNPKHFDRGITFEAPRGSLMTSIKYEIFDDLLIGNFVSTTLHGTFGARGLYPDFTPVVAKYSDNGRVHTRNDLRQYFRAYARRDPLGFLRHKLDAHCMRPLQEHAARALRENVGADSPVFRSLKRAYWTTKRVL